MKTTREKIMEVCSNIEALDSESIWDVFSYVQRRLVLLERYKVPREKCEIIPLPVKRVAS